MKEFVDPGIIDLLEEHPFPDDHPLKSFVAKLPPGHPARELFEGPFRVIGHLEGVLAFFRIFEEIHGDILEETGVSGLLHVPERLTCAEQTQERAAFFRLYPEHDDAAVVHGNIYRLRSLLESARSGIKQMDAPSEMLRVMALDAFDGAFAKLVRAVRSS